MRINPASEDESYGARFKETFFDDQQGAEAARFIETLHCDEPVGVASESSPATIGQFSCVSRHYFRCLIDRAIPAAVQDSIIASVSVLRSKTLWASHSPFLSQPDKLAAALIAATAQDLLGFGENLSLRRRNGSWLRSGTIARSDEPRAGDEEKHRHRVVRDITQQRGEQKHSDRDGGDGGDDGVAGPVALSFRRQAARRNRSASHRLCYWLLFADLRQRAATSDV